MSRGVFRLDTGSLFLAIERLPRDGQIKGEWRPTENNRNEVLCSDRAKQAR